MYRRATPARKPVGAKRPASAEIQVPAQRDAECKNLKLC